MNTRPATPSTATHGTGGDTFASGVLSGLLPLGLFAGLIVLTLALTFIARLIATPRGFFAEEEVDVLVLVTGLGIAVITFIVMAVRAFRRLATWQRDGAHEPANGALLALFATALVLVAPILLALLLPQHPAV